MNKSNDSKVPRFTFPSKLIEQAEALTTNPIMQRFALSRERLSEDPYRPIYHFVSPESSMNDPNGLCFWRGFWHLFYQGYPIEDTKRVHWGHSYSEDLIHWKDLPYAIYPDIEGSCFSGSTYVEDNRVLAMYHGTDSGNFVATSQDDLLLNWEKLTGGPVIPILNPDGTERNFRVFDPFIWKQGNSYYSISGGHAPKIINGIRRRTDSLLRSSDLVSWEYLHEFIEGDTFTLIGDDGACPYFWPIGNRHIFLFFSHKSGGQALLGDYDQDREQFVVTSHHRFTHGAWRPSGLHAPSATTDGKGNVISIFNIQPAMPTGEWNQIMSLPRRFSLSSPDTLSIEPTGGFESLRYDPKRIEGLVLPANQEIVLDEIEGNALEIMAEIEVNDAQAIELDILRCPDKSEYTRVVFYGQRGYRNWEHFTGLAWDKESYANAHDSIISIDTTYSSLLADAQSRPPESAPVYVSTKETLDLHVFIDKSVVEVFVNNRQCVTVRVCPGRKDSIGVSLRAQGRDAFLKSLVAFQMKSIY